MANTIGKARFFLRKAGEDAWREVDLKAYCRAEREAGFFPKIPPKHPKYWKTVATGSFSTAAIEGRVGYEPAPEIAN